MVEYIRPQVNSPEKKVSKDPLVNVLYNQILTIIQRRDITEAEKALSYKNILDTLEESGAYRDDLHRTEVLLELMAILTQENRKIPQPVRVYLDSVSKLSVKKNDNGNIPLGLAGLGPFFKDTHYDDDRALIDTPREHVAEEYDALPPHARRPKDKEGQEQIELLAEMIVTHIKDLIVLIERGMKRFFKDLVYKNGQSKELLKKSIDRAMEMLTKEKIEILRSVSVVAMIDKSRTGKFSLSAKKLEKRIDILRKILKDVDSY